MRVFERLTALAVTFGAVLASGGMALAGLGQPSPWQLGLQQAASPVMDNIIRFHDFLLYITTAITVFVLGLLLYIVVRFNARANPAPSRTTHHAGLEIVWTVVPVLILVAIAVPSFRLLFLQLNEPAPDITVKATGKQWYWSYSYPDNGKFEFNSLMLHRQGAQARPAAAALGRQRDGRAGEQDRARAGHRRRRHSCLRGAVVRHQDRRRARPHQRDLVPGDARRHVSTANARSCAARTMRSCRSRCAS